MVIGILRKVRNEYGKAIRKDYENHKITEKRANMTEYEIQRDGVTHTLTGVTKDNWLVDKVGIRQAVKQGFIECRVGGVFDGSYPNSELRRGRVQGGGDISPTLTSSSMGICRIEKEQDVETEVKYAIRKLTPTECGRLMNFTEPDIKAMLDTTSNSQVYKMCGNSIVVSCLMAIFSQLNIKGVTPWNQLTDEERYNLIYTKDHYKNFNQIVHSNEQIEGVVDEKEITSEEV